MNRSCTMLYNCLLDDLDACRNKGLPEEETVECCYQIALAYWKRLEGRVKHHQFKSKAAEISFFKNCKPQFASQIEYYNLVYHSILFKPVDPVHEMDFWKREAARRDKFLEEHADFASYYKNKCKDKDEAFFLRATSGCSDGDPQAAVRTRCDALVSQLLALEQYDDYVKRKLGVSQRKAM